MSDSTLTTRDRQLAELGYPPLDVSPARRMSEREINDLPLEHRLRVRELQTQGFIPMVERGVQVYRRPEEAERGA